MKDDPNIMSAGRRVLRLDPVMVNSLSRFSGIFEEKFAETTSSEDIP